MQQTNAPTIPLRPTPAQPNSNGQTDQLPASSAPLLVDAHEAARLLGISERTLWTLTQRGEVRCKKIGRRTLYLREALEEFAKR
jgi:excisionase family DNA binding protein